MIQTNVNDATLWRCAKCGKQLTVPAQDSHVPPACDEHRTEVDQEAARDYSMWPDDWAGHAYQDYQGAWRDDQLH